MFEKQQTTTREREQKINSIALKRQNSNKRQRTEKKMRAPKRFEQKANKIAKQSTKWDFI